MEDQKDAPKEEAPRHVRVIEEDVSGGAKRKIAVLIVVAVIIVVGVALYFSLGKQQGINTTTVKTTVATTVPGSSTVTTVNTTTSIGLPIQISAVNLMWSYSGPLNKTINGKKVNCDYRTFTTQKSGFTMNASGTFSYYMPIVTTQCNLTITKVSIPTPGFGVVSTNPKLPYLLTGGSSAQLQIIIRAPSSFANGPLSITLYDKGS